MRSLNVRLVLYLLVPFVALLPLGTVAQYFIALLPVRQALDRGLDNVVRTVAASIQIEGGRLKANLPDLSSDSPKDELLVAVLDANGGLVAGDARLLTHTPAPAREVTQFFDVVGEEFFHLAVRQVPCGELQCEVRVGERSVRRTQLERDLMLSTVFSIALLVVLIGVAMWFGARDGLAPVRQLRAQMAKRSLSNLDPVKIDDPPDELVPIVAAVNELLSDLARAASANLAFVADAAHQLRTPLARCLAQLELALQTGHGEGADRVLLADLKKSLDGMARLTQQLLALARSEATARAAVAFAPLELADLARGRAAFWVPRAVQQQTDLGFDLQPAPVTGNGRLLAELIDNLVDNALRYGGPHVTLRTRVGPDARPTLEVDDDGPGIPSDERERVFERFVRGASAIGEGSGLGLSIVRQVAVLHGGEATVTSGPGAGLRVQVSFPARRPGTP
ncbi:MAG TPA: sensor histidine kinase [Burkholderiaceae bacterium]|nr:sensor histidine kinase [Burkholderiaceae bacterium]